MTLARATLLGAAAIAEGKSTAQRLTNIEAALARIADALVALDARDAELGRAHADLAARVDDHAGRLDRLTPGLAERLDRTDRVLADVAELITVNRWALRGLITVLHPPHPTPPYPPTPIERAAGVAVPPVTAEGVSARDAAEKQHELTSRLLDELGDRLTEQEVNDGPPPPPQW